jgi:hypothetical protein
MQPPSPSLWPPSEGRDWRGRNDGGNNAYANLDRTDAPVANRTVLSRGADHDDAAALIQTARRSASMPTSTCATSAGSCPAGMVALAKAPASHRRQGPK